MVLLRAALARVSRATVPKLPPCLTQASGESMPYLPVDMVFRFFPRWTRDKVRFFYWYYLVSFLLGFGFLMGYSHTPYVGDNYDHFPESPLYKWTKSSLDKTGQLEENLRVKVHHFYPQTE
ncbi:unnamed protein product [Durusdinium trenchii]|uniref:Uncharacterized protein n=1 Tax=Durusdinium trenchii TaxID=1381693 RepID=A0ABP0J5X1_9DINO